jgi:hypothetical protein
MNENRPAPAPLSLPLLRGLLPLERKSIPEDVVAGVTLPQVRGDYCADRCSIAYQKSIERSRMKAPVQSSTIGIKGFTFKASCDNSVAIAPAK